MPLPNVIDGAAIGYDLTFETPSLSEHVRQQKRAGRGGNAVYGIVGRHNDSYLAFTNGSLELRQIGFVKIALRRNGVKDVPSFLGAAVDREVLSASHRLYVIWIVPLQALDEPHREARR